MINSKATPSDRLRAPVRSIATAPEVSTLSTNRVLHLTRQARAYRGPAATEVTLHPVEAVVLHLAHLDPTLTERRHRPRLILLVHAFLPRRSQHRIGMALARLRDLAAAGAIQTRAFIPADNSEGPTLEHCVRVFETLVRGVEEVPMSSTVKQSKWTKVARLLGHEVTL